MTGWRCTQFLGRGARRRARLRAIAALFTGFAGSLAAGAAAAPAAAAPAAADAGNPRPTFSTCEVAKAAPFCAAVRGERAEGWPSQSRSEVLARHGMVVTSQPLAAQAGLQILRRGGNAIDAAVATAAVLNVTEPMMVGLAGDLFALIYIAREHRVYVLDASGRAPSGATAAHFAELGYHADPGNPGPGSGMPEHGILPVTVPGAAWGWDEVVRRFGHLKLAAVLAPAIDYAEHGFPVSERIAHDWRLPPALPTRACCRELDPDSVRTWYVNGRPPVAGQLYRNADLARSLRLLGEQGRDVFYRGEIARAIVAKSTALGGTLRLEDLAAYHGEWVEPARLERRGLTLLELPPPSQAWAALEMLALLDTCLPTWAPGATLASLGPRDARYWHLLIEAKKLAYADLFAFNADPQAAPVPLAKLLSTQHARAQCSRVDPAHAAPTRAPAAVRGAGDTIVLSTADAEGNMVSWVNSNYDLFGSGLTVPGYGFILHDRGALFSLDAGSPNVIAPGKRPFNTLSAGFVLAGTDPVMTVTLMGGSMQAQGHAQLLVDVLDLGANVQAGADMARFNHDQLQNTVALERPLHALVGRALEVMGHHVIEANGAEMGGVQVIAYTPDAQAPAPGRTGDRAAAGVYRGGSDPRKDGAAVGW